MIPSFWAREGEGARGGGRGQRAEQGANADWYTNLAGRKSAAGVGRILAADRIRRSGPRPRVAVIEVGAGRLLPWFAVAFGAGIVLDFTAEREPAWWAASALAAIAIIVTALLRRRPVAFVLGLGLLGMAAGFAAATIKTALIDHPLLRYPAYSVSLGGFVELREESQKTDRFVLRVERIDGKRIVEKPQRVRLSVRRDTAPPAGAFVEVKAQLNPPLEPLRPGGYDFARDLFFQRIGASGFVHGAVRVVAPPTAAGVRMRANASIQGLRDAIDLRIRSVLSGDVGSIALPR